MYHSIIPIIGRDDAASGGSISYLFDSLTGVSAIAYDLKKLRSSYSGACVKVRDTLDDSLHDVGFGSDGNLDWTAAAGFGSDLRIVKWYDQSGNGNDLEQATASKQPTLDQTNKQIVFDASDDSLATASSLSLTSVNDISIIHRTKLNSTAGTQIFFEHSANYNSNNAFVQYLDSGSIDGGQGGGSSVNLDRNASPDTSYHTYALVLDRALATAADQTKLYTDGGVGSSVGGFTADMGGVNFGSHVLYVGARAGSSLYLNGAMKGFAVFTSALGSSDQSAVENASSGLGIQN